VSEAFIKFLIYGIMPHGSLRLQFDMMSIWCRDWSPLKMGWSSHILKRPTLLKWSPLLRRLVWK